MLSQSLAGSLKSQRINLPVVSSNDVHKIVFLKMYILHSHYTSTVGHSFQPLSLSPYLSLVCLPTSHSAVSLFLPLSPYLLSLSHTNKPSFSFVTENCKCLWQLFEWLILTQKLISQLSCIVQVSLSFSFLENVITCLLMGHCHFCMCAHVSSTSQPDMVLLLFSISN